MFLVGDNLAYFGFMLTKNRDPRYTRFNEVTNNIGKYLYDKDGVCCSLLNADQLSLRERVYGIAQTRLDTN